MYALFGIISDRLERIPILLSNLESRQDSQWKRKKRARELDPRCERYSCTRKLKGQGRLFQGYCTRGEGTE